MYPRVVPAAFNAVSEGRLCELMFGNLRSAPLGEIEGRPLRRGKNVGAK
jgi:hypothetical protein